jgi:hypothetical protein
MPLPNFPFSLSSFSPRCLTDQNLCGRTLINRKLCCTIPCSLLIECASLSGFPVEGLGTLGYWITAGFALAVFKRYWEKSTSVDKIKELRYLPSYDI